MASMDPRFFTLSDVAQILNLSEPTVYAMARSGELPAVKFGARGVWRVDRDELEAFIDEQKARTRAFIEQHPLTVRDG
jgi:excisionase family DNA binding protein